MTVLNVRRLDALPPLAWLAFLDSEGGRIVCGRSVRCGQTHVFEGAFAGADDARDPGRAADVFGSGLSLEPQGWLAIPPSHLLEGVYALQRCDDWVVSNSLALMKAATGFEFNMHGAPLLASLAEAALSLRAAPVAIPTDQGALHLIYHHNARLGRTLTIRPKPVPAPFMTFEGYRSRLLDVLRGAAADAGRSFVVAVSRGYDSVACAALVAALGGGEALSFRSARGGADDGGAPIATLLGLSCTEFDRPEKVAFESAVQFLSAGLGGEDALYAVAREALAGRILVSGFHGDKVWDLWAKPSRTLKRGDLSGASLGEFRLAADFVHVPVPFIGAVRHPELNRIAHSSAMANYRVGGSYDRPIPRRIAETAGAPRGAFGVRKHAVSLSPGLGLEPIEQGHLAARARHLAGLGVWRLLHGGGRRLGPFRTAAVEAAHEIFPRLFGHPFAVFEHTGPVSEPLFRAALAQMSAVYRKCLETQSAYA